MGASRIVVPLLTLAATAHVASMGVVDQCATVWRYRSAIASTCGPYAHPSRRQLGEWYGR